MKKAFTLLELLYVLLISAILYTAAIPSFYNKLIIEKIEAAKADLKGAIRVTEKLKEKGYEIPNISFTAAKNYDFRNVKTDTQTYRYILDYKGMSFTLKQLEDGENNYCIVINSSVKNPNDLDICYKYNSAEDSTFYKTTKCTCN